MEYQIIADLRDITGSSSPRIVKLHGSFPSNRPFVFTKSDYERYEEESAPFVNMVRQSIMETTMILIGFSGNDPNFKNWVKWIEESLGEHSPKIYMIDLNIKNVEKHPIIVPVDLEGIFDETLGEQRYEVFLSEFLEFLGNQPILNPKKWPYIPYNKTSKIKGFNKDIDLSESKEVIKKLKENREQYPGWLLLPYKIFTKEYISFTLDDLEHRIKYIDDNDIKFDLLFELLWIYKTWRIPLYQNISEEIEKLISQDDNPTESFNKDRLITICIYLLKEYKLDHNHDKFDSLLEKINQWNPTQNQKNEIDYQLYSYKFINGEYVDLSSLIIQKYNETDDFELKIKFAVLMLRIGEEKEAITLMKNLLNNLRKIELLDSYNMRAFSSEGIILSHLRHRDRTNIEQYNERLLDLEDLYCSPTSDLDKFTLFKEPIEQSEYEYSTFDNRTTMVNISISNDSSAYINTNYLLSVRDDYFLGVNSEHKMKLLKYTTNLYPVYGVKLSTRLLNKNKEVEQIFSRKILLNLDKKQVNELYSYLKNLIKLERKINNLKVVYDVFYRLYMIVGDDKRREMELILHENYKTGRIFTQLVENTGLIKKMYERILDYKFSEDYIEFVEELLNYPLIGEPNTDLNNIKLNYIDSFDPLIIAYISKPLSYKAENIEVDSNLTDNLINYFEDSDNNELMIAAFNRLVFINSINGLLPDQKDKIKNILSNYLLENTLLLSNYNKLKFAMEFNLDSDVKETLKNNYIYKEIPRNYFKGSYSSGSGLENYLMNVEILFLENLLNEEEFNLIVNKICNWWEDQYKFYDISSRPFLFGGQEFEKIIKFFSNYVFQNENTNQENINLLNQINDIFNELYEDDNPLYILVFPFLCLQKDKDSKNILEYLENMLIDFNDNNNVMVKKFSYTILAINNIILKENLVDKRNVGKIVDKLVSLLSSLTKSTLHLVLNELHEITKKRYELLNTTHIEYILTSFDNFYDKYVNTGLITTFKWIEQFNILFFIFEMGEVFYKNSYDFDFEKWINFMKNSKIPRLKAYSLDLSKK